MRFKRTKPKNLQGYDEIRTLGFDWRGLMILSLFILPVLLVFGKYNFVEDTLGKVIQEVEAHNEVITDGGKNHVGDVTEMVKEVSKQAPIEVVIEKPIPTKVEKKEVVIDSKFDMNKLYNFVREGEGAFQAEAFCDSYYKTDKGLIRHPAHLCEKWTIGFGTNSYQGEKITYDEAIRRKQEAINYRNAIITTSCFTENQRIAAVDFIYQYSSRYANQMVRYANDCNVAGAFQYIVAHRDFYKSKQQWGLVKREQKRINIFYK